MIGFDKSTETAPAWATQLPIAYAILTGPGSLLHGSVMRARISLHALV
jgi:hypothetical protein